jgi:AcrR family transcriptional regulator
MSLPPGSGPDADVPASDGRRARSKAANRRAIVDAGRRVFARLGFEATTVRDIIGETCLAAGTFYNYFKSKEEVFHAIAEDSAKQFRELLGDVRARATDFETYARDAYRAYFRFIAGQNENEIARGAPHLALIGVRVDTPEMQAVAEEIRSDLEHIFSHKNAPKIDIGYLAAAAIGIAREMGDGMLQRKPLDPDGAADFAAALLIGGARAMAGQK